MDFIDRIMAYESGTLSEGEIIELFQELIDTGQAWTLQGSYGRNAAALIEAGICAPNLPEGCRHIDYTENEMDGTGVCNDCGRLFKDGRSI